MSLRAGMSHGPGTKLVDTSWKWTNNSGDPMVWVGRVEAGFFLKLRGSGPDWEDPDFSKVRPHDYREIRTRIAVSKKSGDILRSGLPNDPLHPYDLGRRAGRLWPVRLQHFGGGRGRRLLRAAHAQSRRVACLSVRPRRHAVKGPQHDEAFRRAVLPDQPAVPQPRGDEGEGRDCGDAPPGLPGAGACERQRRAKFGQPLHQL